jgi:DNA-damage-inducible protein J
MSTTLLRARVDTRHAREAKKILAGLGLDTTSAVNMLFAQVVAHRGLPFPVQESGYAYAAREYGLTRAEVDAADKRIRRSIARERRAGTLKPVPATWQELKKML